MTIKIIIIILASINLLVNIYLLISMIKAYKIRKDGTKQILEELINLKNK